MHTLTIEIPDQFEKKEVLLSIAVQLFKKGALDAKQAADLADVSLNDLSYYSLPEGDPAKELLEPTTEYASTVEWIESIKQEQSYKGFDEERMKKLADKMDIQEPFELLLSQLNK
ncbi:hypothetical protein [Dyadobacter sp. Leaf189]|uniref:hypothetical protein n=1 Tax=Dyadobacter sp. Leaf189 TaxID=1736295 RepID=UPI0006FCA24E|nr:hypothetical protein [Dyadobacter sp. Leaf189]KQS31176.1 hypothetical protein ASG33_12620 [Dyadobacter sp. Leaf189]